MIEIIDILKPKNGGNFKLVDAIDIAVSGYQSLADAVSHMATTAMIEAINTVLSGKQDTLTTAQLTAVNSGITSELVAQITANTTAITGKADASDVATETANLQAQIDNIVSGSTEDAEVINARVGEDGTSYGTLKARLDAEDSFNLDNTKQVSKNVDALCDVIGVGFLPKSKTATLTTNSKRFLNVGNLKNGKTYTFTFTINKAAAQPVYFGIKNDAGSLASRNIAAGLTSHTYSYTADADYNDVYVSVTLYEELTVSVAVTATGFDKDKVSQNVEDIEDIQADNASTANDIKELIDIVGAKFIPKSITKKADGSKNHFFEVGNLYYNATYTFVYSISEAVAHPVYFTLQTSEKTISTYNIAAGSTTQTLTYTADDFYEDAYISITAYEPVTITINVTATGYGNDQVTKNKNNIAAMQLSLNAFETAFDDITVDVSDYTDVTSEATMHDNEFVSWFSLTPTEANGWQYFTLAVTAGQTYSITSYGGSSARNWILAVDGTIVDYCEESTQATRTVEVAIEQSGVLYVNNNKSATASIKLKNPKTGIDGEQVYLDSEPIDERLARSNTLYKKILCCCGDSITYGDDMDSAGFTNNPDVDVYQWSSSQWNKLTSNVRMTWGYQIASRNNMTFYNNGVNGSTMQGMSDHSGFSLANGRYTELPNNIDYLVIFFGWNDTAYGTLGTLSDSTNESYYGGYNTVIPYLQNKYPYTKICLVVPFGCDAGHRNAIRELCNKWGLACFDMYQAGTPLYYGKEDSVGVDASVVTANRAKFQANGAHPNYKGHTQIADMLENFLRGI